MARWRQVIDPQTGKSELIPINEAARRADGAAFVQGDIQSFVSPIDGTVISDRKQLREHNKRHGVVNTSEFGTEHWERKAKEREKFYDRSKLSPREKQARRMEINEIINHLERAK